MKVSQLIDILQQEDPEATVLLMEQENWPFENSIRGVVARHEFEEPEDDECRAPNDERRDNDVFLVEGCQLRYGNRNAFDAARGQY